MANELRKEDVEKTIEHFRTKLDDYTTERLTKILAAILTDNIGTARELTKGLHSTHLIALAKAAEWLETIANDAIPEALKTDINDEE